MERSGSQSQGTDQPGLLRTWIKKRLTCKCGKEYETGYWVSADVQISKPAEFCRYCQERLDTAERIKASEVRLPDVIQELKWKWLDECGLPLKYFDKTFDNFDSKLQPVAFNAMRAYGNEAEDGHVKSVVLSSGDIYGVGKTHLVAAVINKIIKEATGARVQADGRISVYRRPVRFTIEATLLNRIKATYNHHHGDDRRQETEEDVYKELINIPHLFIDDVGKVRPKDLSFLQGVYYQIIDGRYCFEMPIVLTTNLGFTELEEHIGGASADRLKEMCGKGNIIKMTGKSQRKGDAQL